VLKRTLFGEFYKASVYLRIGMENQEVGCLSERVTEILINICTWIGFLSVISTLLLLGLTGWMYLLKKIRSKTP
jgi:hypothetical protein